MIDPRPSWMNTELEDVRDLARTFFTKEVAPLEEKFLAQGHPDKELYQRAGELGLVCTSIPEQYGGGGGTIAHEIVLAQEQVRSGVESLGLAVHSGIVAHYINAYGNEQQKQNGCRNWRAASGCAPSR